MRARGVGPGRTAAWACVHNGEMGTESPSPKLLLVEDDSELVRMLTRVLTTEGYAVDTALDGQRGLHLALTRTYELVVLDRGLPAIDGLTIATSARGKEKSLPPGTTWP